MSPAARAPSAAAAFGVPAAGPERVAVARVWWPPLWLALVVSYGYVFGVPAWNQNSRLALTRAIVERGTLAIDPDAETTGDKSERGGHVYSDKAPGASLLAVPAYATWTLVRRITGGEPPEVSVRPLDPFDEAAGRVPEAAVRGPGDRLRYNRGFRVALWLCGLCTSGLATLLAVLAVRMGARAWGADERDAAIVALIYGLGTPAFPYATVFYGHQPAAGTLAIGLALVLWGRWSAAPPVRVAAQGLAVGCAFGAAVLCEYPSAAAVVLGVALTAILRGPRATGWVIAGGLPWALGLAAYHTLAFGHPLRTGYDFLVLPEFAEGMAVRYGIGAPDLHAAWALTFGSYRGLFYGAPVLVLAVWGLAHACTASWTRPAARERRAAATVASVIVLGYGAMAAGYYMWDGGAAIGPRHALPALPWLALGLVPVLRIIPRAVTTLGLVSIGLMTLAAIATPEAPRHGDPLWEHAWPRLLAAGSAGDGTTNLGAALGLPGIWSVAPLAALWVLAWGAATGGSGPGSARPGGPDPSARAAAQA
jgi:hypothetical protein